MNFVRCVCYQKTGKKCSYTSHKSQKCSTNAWCRLLQTCITDAVIALSTMQLLQRKTQMKLLMPSKIYAWMHQWLHHEQLIIQRTKNNNKKPVSSVSGAFSFQSKVGWKTNKNNKQMFFMLKYFLKGLTYPPSKKKKIPQHIRLKCIQLHATKWVCVQARKRRHKNKKAEVWRQE